MEQTYWCRTQHTSMCHVSRAPFIVYRNSLFRKFSLGDCLKISDSPSWNFLPPSRCAFFCHCVALVVPLACTLPSIWGFGCRSQNFVLNGLSTPCFHSYAPKRKFDIGISTKTVVENCIMPIQALKGLNYSQILLFFARHNRDGHHDSGKHEFLCVIPNSYRRDWQ